MKVNAPKGDKLVGGGDFLKVPGTYQFLITSLNAGVGPKGTAIDGFTAECKVLAGLADDKSNQVNKEISLTFFAPNLTSSEKAQEMTHCQNTAFFIATNCLTPDQLGQEDLEVNEELAGGMQFFCRMACGQKKQDDGTYVDSKDAPLRIHFSDIFHVDDPAVAKVPRNADALALIEPQHRHKAAWFDYKKSKHEKGSAAATQKPNNYDDEEIV